MTSIHVRWMKNIGLALVSAAGLWLMGKAIAAAPPLVEAAKHGDAQTVRTLLNSKADVNAPEPDGTTALHWAARSGDLAMVNLLLAAHANPGAVNRYGVRPLSLAVLSGSPGVVEALLKTGADPNTANAEGETALMTASRSGNLAAVKALIARGADVNAKERWLQETALMWAAAENHADVVDALIAAGANKDQKSWVTDTPILDFPESGGPNTPFPRGGWTAAMYAARQNATAALRVLADRGANMDAQDPQGATAMQIAIINLHYDAAGALLDKGANPNIADQTGMTALYALINMDTLAWIQGRPAPALDSNAEYDAVVLANKLLDKGADPNPRLKTAILKRHHDFQPERFLTEGATPLMRAARYGDARLARVLLERGANPRLTTNDGTNSLMYAAGVNLPAVRGEDPSLLHPSEDGSIEIIKMLLDQGMDLNTANNQGLTALHGAVQRSQGTGNGTGEKIISFLVNHGARLDIRDKKGRTPLDLARSGEGQILNRVEDSGPAARLLARLGGEAGPYTTQPTAAKTDGTTLELKEPVTVDIWGGVYTSAQADRGKNNYRLYCQSCHGENLTGQSDSAGRAPALRGEIVVRRKDVGNLFAYIREWMPFEDRGSLDDTTVIDILTYILQQNGYPAGEQELVPNRPSLKRVLFTQKP
jgi:uncharacterized protein